MRFQTPDAAQRRISLILSLSLSQRKGKNWRLRQRPRAPCLPLTLRLSGSLFPLFPPALLLVIQLTTGIAFLVVRFLMSCSISCTVGRSISFRIEKYLNCIMGDPNQTIFLCQVGVIWTGVVRPVFVYPSLRAFPVCIISNCSVMI
jgi:hypothetical protein